YGQMIADSLRVDAYERALAQAIKPGSVVLDIGAGAGFFSMLACLMGADRVYAIEPGDAIHLARKIAASSGLSDRIEFIQDLSTRVTLARTADVIVSDLRGVLPLFKQNISSIIDARRRLLSPGGTLIAERDLMWAAVVEAKELYDSLVQPWEKLDRIDMRAARRVVLNNCARSRVDAEQLLTAPERWGEIDYATIEDPSFSNKIELEAGRRGSAHGFALWFDSVLAKDVFLTNAPGQPALIYGNLFFPFLAPVTVEAGDRIALDLKATMVGDNYLWQWTTEIKTESGIEKAAFNQSTFWGVPLSLAALHKREGGFRPAPNEEATALRLALALMDGETSLKEIARKVFDRVPSRFASFDDALDYVSDLSIRYSL
ncbi:MAG TPA: methyltransferase domain-containing protein, partial [Blastocatellia bacterium]|nr:methyltransferase domain-containing protein [Blastocatellia bacterium]